jgi:pimeloyl-ACP methyl ester carboxylesterase
MNQQYKLIQTYTKDELKLSGLLIEGSKNKPATIFIHGFTGDFYSHKFYHVLADKYKDNNEAFLLAQHRGTGLHTEFIKKNGEGVYIGSFYELLEDAHLDISAFIEELQKLGYTSFNLIGHSLGTFKVVRYLFEGEYADKITKLTLLSPFDKNAYMVRKQGEERLNYIKKAQEVVANGGGDKLVPVPEFEDYEMSYKTFCSWYSQDDFGFMQDFYRANYDFPILSKINIPVEVVIGSKDEFMTFPELGVTNESALATMKKYIKNCTTRIVEGAGHTYLGFEDQL